MSHELVPIVLALTGLSSLALLVDGLVRRALLLRRIERSRWDVPRDPATGLYSRAACLQRLTAEQKRAARTGGSVWVGILTVAEGEADRFGRNVHDSLRFPELGFRLDERVLCVVRPDLDSARRADLLGRLGAAAPRERLAIGESQWTAGEQVQPAELLRRAAAATTAAATARPAMAKPHDGGHA